MKITIRIVIIAGIVSSALALIAPESGLYKRAKAKGTTNKNNGNVSAAGPFVGKLTNYKVGNDACGTHSKGTDMVAALNKPQYGNTDSRSPNCGRCAKIKGDKATVVVKIIDACPECKFGSLDLSKSAFKAVTNADGEAKNISWSWVDC
ncbi:hypothetical protein GGI20_003062 [Coemansia sp. BCRC 34301]|nr:hypothetical protein GGI20_003062 [Coemansia sp. BCRC 34301]